MLDKQQLGVEDKAMSPGESKDEPGYTCPECRTKHRGFPPPTCRGCGRAVEFIFEPVQMLGNGSSAKAERKGA